MNISEIDNNILFEKYSLAMYLTDNNIAEIETSIKKLYMDTADEELVKFRRWLEKQYNPKYFKPLSGPDKKISISNEVNTYFNTGKRWYPTKKWCKNKK